MASNMRLLNLLRINRRLLNTAAIRNYALHRVDNKTGNFVIKSPNKKLGYEGIIFSFSAFTQVFVHSCCSKGTC